MEKESNAKLDTILNICLNKNPGWVTLSEPLYNVEFIKLEYFRVSNINGLYWPAPQLYLELDNLKSRPRLVTNVVTTNDWVSTVCTPPSANHYPLYFKTDPINIPGRVIHGKQSHLNFIAEDFGRLSDFHVRLLGPDHQPIAFDLNTVLQLVFRVHYQGKRNLDPNDQVRQYSKFQN